MLENWIALLTSKGYDIIGSNGYTVRHDAKEEYWNTNLPMPHLRLHFRSIKEQKTKFVDIVVNCYATNSHNFTVYGMGFSGKAEQQYAGFIVQGMKEQEIASLEELKKFLEFVKDRNF